MSMRHFLNLLESIDPEEKKRISLMRPVLAVDGWEVARPGFFETHTAQRLLNRQTDHTWEWCNDAIQELRTMAGLKPKEFQKPPEKSKEGFLATSPKTLLHGTSAAAVPSIQAVGLIPQVGKFVAGAHGKPENLVYAGAINDFHRIVAAMFFQGSPIETDADFFDRTALLTLTNDGKWYRTKSGYHSPVGTEGGDFYRSKPIMPKNIIVGDNLRDFFENKIGKMPSDFIDFIARN